MNDTRYDARVTPFINNMMLATANGNTYIALCRKLKDRNDPESGLRACETPGGMMRTRTLTEIHGQPVIDQTYDASLLAASQRIMALATDVKADPSYVLTNEWSTANMQALTNIYVYDLGEYGDEASLPAIQPAPDEKAMDWVNCAAITKADAEFQPVAPGSTTTVDEMNRKTGIYKATLLDGSDVEIISDYGHLINRVLGEYRKHKLMADFGISHDIITKHVPDSDTALGQESATVFKAQQSMAQKLRAHVDSFTP